MNDTPTTLFAAKPKAFTWWEKGETYMIRCPVCGHTDNDDNFDCIGADVDCVFCNVCDAEICLS